MMKIKYNSLRYLFLLFAVLGLTRPFYGQMPVFQNVIFVSVAPSGACTNGSPAQIVVSTGIAYTCQNSVWGSIGGGGTAVQTNTPSWLQWLGTGADGANITASGNLQGVKYYTNFTVPFGNTVTVNGSQGLVIYATGACTIAGTISAVGSYTSSSAPASGGSAGGSGGGTLTGAAGGSTTYVVGGSGLNVAASGTAGASSGGTGGNGNAPAASSIRGMTASGGGAGGLLLGGGRGAQGGSSGGALGNGGGDIVMICASITGTDGVHTGTIDVSGTNGVNPTANSTGAGSGGGGGVALLSSQAAVATWPAVYTAPGAGAWHIVPQAVGQGGTCTDEPVASLGVNAGPLSGAATVVHAGAGCGTGTGLTWVMQGGGCTFGTAVFNPTFSAGALASATVTVGNSSGCTASTFTTSGDGGGGGAGWYAEFAAGVQVH